MITEQTVGGLGESELQDALSELPNHGNFDRSAANLSNTVGGSVVVTEGTDWAHTIPTSKKLTLHEECYFTGCDTV
jgi:hypothetical protein